MTLRGGKEGTLAPYPRDMQTEMNWGYMRAVSPAWERMRVFHNRKRQGTRMSKVLGSLLNKKERLSLKCKERVFRLLAL